MYEETYDEAIRFAPKYPDTLWRYGNHDVDAAMNAINGLGMLEMWNDALPIWFKTLVFKNEDV